MKKYRHLVLYILLFLVLAMVALYLLFLFILPPVLSSSFFFNRINKIVYAKTGIQTDSVNFKIKTYPNLVIFADAEKLVLKSKDKTELLTAKNASVSYDLKSAAIKKLNIDYIFINETGFKKIVSKNKNKKTSDFNIKQLPQTDIKKAEIWVDKNGLESVFVIFSEIHIINQADNKTYCSFEAEIISTLLRNLVTIGKTGYLYIKDNALFANKLEVLVGVSSVKIDGKIIDDNNKTDFTIKGGDIPVSDAMTSLLYFQKLKESGKKFIENFYDFSGTLDVDASIKEDGLHGKCEAKKLAAKTVLFDVPVFFNSVIFNFDKKNISASAYGTLGGEKVFTSFDILDIGTTAQTVSGSVYSKLSNQVVHKYIPYVWLEGFADTRVNYSVKNKKINVDYLLKFKEGSDIHYKNAYLGLKDKNRRLLVNTLKENDKLYISHYDYSLQNGSNVDNIILGNGLFIKKDGHLKIDNITCKTNGYAPVSVAGSFGRYLQDGFFSGDLKYDFEKNLLSGLFSLKNTRYKNFFVNEAKIIADDKTMKIKADGEYEKSEFHCTLEAENKFTDKINIYNMDLFLDEYVIKKYGNSSSNPSSSAANIAEQAKDVNIEIAKWIIKLNKIKRNRIELTDILLTGSLKNDIFKFSVPHINFAGGILKANGMYNIKDSSSELFFRANNIDSNTVADVIFNLPGQISGLADAYLHAKTKNGLDKVNAYASFSVKKGYLPRLGSTEFIIKSSRRKQPLRFKLSDIINVDIKNMKAMSSDINGNFYFDNDCIRDAKLTTSQKYLSLLIEGNYNLNKQQGDLDLFGKYNNEQISRVKIFFVPLSLIVKLVFRPEETMYLYRNKLKEVPQITALPNEGSAFRVKVQGNLNKNDLKVELKSLK